MPSPSPPAPAAAVLVFAKAPEPGRVKTRMCPPLSLSEAASFYASMLEDVLEATAAYAKRLGLDAVLCLDSAVGSAALPFVVPALFTVEPQRGSGLAARMDSALQAAFERGARRVLLRGSDTPTLSQEHLEEALSALEAHEFVVSPGLDGGYGLVGFSSFRPGLLDVPMSTGTVCEETLARARAWGVRGASVSPCFDLDSWEDLAELEAVRRQPAALLCPRTLAFLEARGG